MLRAFDSRDGEVAKAHRRVSRDSEGRGKGEEEDFGGGKELRDGASPPRALEVERLNERVNGR